MDTSALVHRYIEGLKPATKLEVQMCDLQTLNKAEVQALHMDDIHFLKNTTSLIPATYLYHNVHLHRSG